MFLNIVHFASNFIGYQRVDYSNRDLFKGGRVSLSALFVLFTLHFSHVSKSLCTQTQTHTQIHTHTHMYEECRVHPVPAQQVHFIN